MPDDGSGYRYRLSHRARERLAPLAKMGLPLADSFPSFCELTAREVDRVNNSLPRLLVALFGNEDEGAAALIGELDLPAPQAFLCAAVSAALAGSVEGWLLNMGMGGWERTPSWRLIPQISPVLQSAKRLEEAGFRVPRIQVFKANALARFVNHLDAAKLAKTSAATLRFIAEYTTDWYPTLRPALELEEDAATWLAGLVDDVLRPIATSAPLDPDIERLSRNRSSPLMGMIYGLSHAFQLQHIVGKASADRRLWSSGRDAGIPKAVVTFGGAPERLFTNIIRTAVDAAPAARFQRVPRARIITRLCRKPAYMPMAEETPITQVPSLREIRLQSALPAIADDWKQLKMRHGFDLAIASGSGATPFARLAATVQSVAGIAG